MVAWYQQVITHMKGSSFSFVWCEEVNGLVARVDSSMEASKMC